MTKVKEFFTSIQGEGPYVGYKQLFIRFCRCNLNCNYCDTDFRKNEKTLDYTPQELFTSVAPLLNNIHSVSLTGGEPLLETEFLRKFLPLLKGYKIYLETNGTLSEELLEIKPYIDIISADIKLESATDIKNLCDRHDEFFKACQGVETFAKIVFDSTITDEEIQKTAVLGKKYGIELILSPKMVGNKPSVGAEFISAVLDKYLAYYEKVRVIPQVHKFMGVE